MPRVARAKSKTEMKVYKQERAEVRKDDKKGDKKAQQRDNAQKLGVWKAENTPVSKSCSSSAPILLPLLPFQ